MRYFNPPLAAAAPVGGSPAAGGNPKFVATLQDNFTIPSNFTRSISLLHVLKTDADVFVQDGFYGQHPGDIRVKQSGLYMAEARIAVPNWATASMTINLMGNEQGDVSGSSDIAAALNPVDNVARVLCKVSADAKAPGNTWEDVRIWLTANVTGLTLLGINSWGSRQYSYLNIEQVGNLPA